MKDPYAAYRNPVAETAIREVAKAHMIKGVLWLLGGGAVSLIAYSSAGAGEEYPVFWGAMVYGAWRFLKALYYWANPNALQKKIEGA